MPQQYGSGGSGWAALAAALQGLGQGFQTKRDLDEQDRERARRQAMDELQRQQIMEQIRRAGIDDTRAAEAFQETQRVNRANEDWRTAANAAPNTDLTEWAQSLTPERLLPVKPYMEHTPGRNTLPSRDLPFDLPPGPLETPSPSDPIGQALAARPSLGPVETDGPLHGGNVPEQYMAVGTAAVQAKAAQEARLREKQAQLMQIEAEEQRLAERRLELDDRIRTGGLNLNDARTRAYVASIQAGIENDARGLSYRKARLVFDIQKFNNDPGSSGPDIRDMMLMKYSGITMPTQTGRKPINSAEVLPPDPPPTGGARQRRGTGSTNPF